MRTSRLVPTLLVAPCLLGFVHGIFAQELAPIPRRAGIGHVYVANGAGDSNALTENLQAACDMSGVPVVVHNFRWCRHGRLVLDHRDVEGHVQAGAILAERVVRCRQFNPQDKVYLIGHSAGAHVALVAAERLPPAYVERIVLFAPAVSHRYDLRPALMCSRTGIDSFHSGRDMMVAGAMLVGTADGQVGQAAGKIGFTPAPSSELDRLLYLSLRQHAWNDEMARAGHNGGHFGMARGSFLQSYIVPLFAQP